MFLCVQIHIHYHLTQNNLSSKKNLYNGLLTSYVKPIKINQLGFSKIDARKLLYVGLPLNITKLSVLTSYVHLLRLLWFNSSK